MLESDVLQKYKDNIIGYSYIIEKYDGWNIVTYAVVNDGSILYIPLDKYECLTGAEVLNKVEKLGYKGYKSQYYWYNHVREKELEEQSVRLRKM